MMTLNLVPTTAFISIGLLVTLEPAPVPAIVVSIAMASAMVLVFDAFIVNRSAMSEETRPIQVNFASSKRRPGVPISSSRISP
jgi:hypothetical protein